MSLKAFAFTTDATVALAIIAVAFGAVTLTGLAQPAAALDVSGNTLLAHDYLVLKYVKETDLDQRTFEELTGKKVVETRPETGDWVAAQVVVVPKLLGCREPTACGVTASAANSFFNKFDGLNSTIKRAWVSK